MRFESDSILGMRIQSRSNFPKTGECLAYQRDTYTNVTGRDLDLARTNIASEVSRRTILSRSKTC